MPNNAYKRLSLVFVNVFCHCHVMIPYVKIISSSGSFEQKIVKLRFSNSSVQSQQSNDSRSVTIDTQLSCKFLKKK